MLYIHENNLLNKIDKNYRGHATEISRFYNEKYLPMRSSVLEIPFQDGRIEDFRTACNIINTYYADLRRFSSRYNISSQSKFESTFLEEISVYLFGNIREIRNGTYGIFNKKIYAGLKIDSNNRIAIITKDVDFCIGKKATISIDGEHPVDLILPIVAVEVKTYLDATMFGEIKSSSKSIRSASPTSKTYVLMGYKCLADEHIIAARQDSTLSEMFVLRENEFSPIDANALYAYWEEITSEVNNITADNTIVVPGRLLRG